jgi:DEAD/DEAH box helicase domain-containing protein
MPSVNAVAEFLEQKFHKEIKAHHILSPTPGELSDYPETLHPKLQAVLREQGIAQLYAHQVESFEPISRGKDCLLVSRTASGKTLSFLLPILNEYLKTPAPFGVMLMYPTKALSRDQESTLGQLLQAAGAELKLGTFDGDTPQDERRRISGTADFVITNPDMLHSGLLPNHNRRWKSFLSRLRYIVIDEVHTYRGSFGSHVANVFRRLLRACEIHGSRPTFVCSSATIGNPGEHVQALFQREFHVVDKDGAPRPKRNLYMVNPALVQSHGHALYRKGPGSVSISLMRFAAQKKIRTICFCRARQQVERLYKAVIDQNPDLKSVIKPYRGGLLPNERRKLERDLAAGRLNTIITTNALELGIDIGGLDLCILSGHPGTFSSFWQQAGRVGRAGKEATIVYVAKDAPIDQFLVHHPEFITQAPIERAWLNADNPYILLQHLPCAAYEHPLRPEEVLFNPPAYPQALDVLKGDKVVKPWREVYRYALEDYPARGVNLRGMTDYNIDIYCGSEVIGELDPIGARGTLYKDAIYQHLGRRYMSLDLDLQKKLCKVEEVNVDYYTEAVWENRITLTEVDESRQLQDAKVDFGYVLVNKQPKLYKKIRERSFENIGYGPITLDAFEYDTTGLCLLPPHKWQAAMADKDKRYIDAALYGLSYLLKRTAPSVCMGDFSDIDTDVALIENAEENWRSALYLFDTIEGGVGYAEKVYELLETVLGLCRQIITECECAAGCPSCVPPLPPGVNNEELEELFIESNAAVRCTISLLNALLDGQVEVPQIQVLKKTIKAAEAPPADEEAIKLNNRLQKASNILKRKRERLH